MSETQHNKYHRIRTCWRQRLSRTNSLDRELHIYIRFISWLKCTSKSVSNCRSECSAVQVRYQAAISQNLGLNHVSRRMRTLLSLSLSIDLPLEAGCDRFFPISVMLGE